MAKEPTIAQAEAAARRMLRPKLKSSLAAARALEALFRGQLRQYELASGGSWLRVQQALISRTVNNLRVCEHALLSGYPVQAMAIGTSIYELAYTAAYIANSEERAEIWLNHKERYKTPWRRSIFVAGAAANANVRLSRAADDMFYDCALLGKAWQPAPTCTTTAVLHTYRSRTECRSIHHADRHKGRKICTVVDAPTSDDLRLGTR
jgi:hypothetical protein